MEKDDILDAIRRSAIDNGGKPPGSARFYAETGITRYQLNQLWRSYSDALAEAGYEPNAFSRAYSDDGLLEPLGLLVRDIGRFPVEAELLMRRRADDSFPSAVSFRRLGTTQTRIDRLAEWCSTRDDFADVYAICAPLVASTPTHDENEGTAPANADGFVYLVKSGKHYKIGRSNSAGRRFYEIELQLPDKLTVVHHVKTDDPVGIERYWHTRFADKRANGEWFALTSADVKAFKRRKQFM